MNDSKVPDVPYIIHEAEMARQERTIRRLWILCVIIFAALIITNGAWLYYESQWEDITVTQENGDAPNNYIGNDGDIYNGVEDGKTDDNDEAQEDGR